jgi:substrate import-associated zinc metallohydrolase lipoprotein
MNNLRIYLTAMLVTGILASCKKDNPGDVSNIPGLGGDSTVATSIDNWIRDTLTIPYNVSAKYRWDQGELDFSKNLTPPDESKIIPVLSSIKKVWIDNYVAEAGKTFMKTYIPKFFVLVGSASWNIDGTITLGTAEGGREIVLYVLNDFLIKGMAGYVPADSFNIKLMFHTIEHEFGHILHQTVLYPAAFKQISVGSYTSNWNNTTDKQANENGFVTAYAQSAYDEDFVETIAIMLIEGKAGFDALVNGISSATARDKLRQKEAIVVNYYKDVWGINFYSLQARTRASIDALIK